MKRGQRWKQIGVSECKNPVCIEGCPVNIDIRSFIQLVMQKDYAGAVQKIREANSLPAICGRVSPRNLNAKLFARWERNILQWQSEN